MLKTIINRKLTIFIFIVSIFIFLIVSPLTYKHEIGYIETPLNEIVYSVQSIFPMFADYVEGIWLDYFYLVNLHDENSRLRKEVTQLSNKVLSMRSLESENARFKKMMAYKQKSGYQLLSAGIIGANPTNWFQTFVINKGAVDGIRVGMGVLSGSGRVVGKVMKTTGRFASVLLLKDMSIVVPAMIERTRDQGLVEGKKGNVVRMKYLPVKSEIEIDDRVVTSGLMGSFPKGLEIGIVQKIEPIDINQFIDLEIQISADFSTLEELFVVLPDEEMMKELKSLELKKPVNN